MCAPANLLLYADQFDSESASAPAWTSAPQERPTYQEASRSVHVLVAEDEPVVRRLIARLLTEHGYMVQVAENGAEALRFAVADPTGFDMLITDVRMPVMDGWELGQRVRERWPSLPILYISGYDVGVAARQQRTSRTSGILEKPFDPTVLLVRVEELLQSS